MTAVASHYRRLVALAVIGVGVYGVVTGVMVLMSSDERTSGPSLVAASWFAHSLGLKAHVLLGTCSVLAGLLTLAPWRHVNQAGLAASAVGALFLCGSYIVSANLEPTANLYGITGQAFIALAIGSLLVLRAADRASGARR